MQINTKFFKLLFLSLILGQFVLGQVAMAQAATDSGVNYNFTYTGAEDSIKSYLCTPNTANTGTNIGSGSINGSQTAVSGANNTANNDLYNCINRLYRFAIVIAVTASVFMLVIAGYVYMSAEGNTEAVSKAKDILVSTITSLVILFTGYILLRALNPDLISFQNVQPPSVRVATSSYVSILASLPDTEKAYVALNSNGNIQVKGSANGNADTVKNAGCDFQTPRQQTEVSQLVSAMYQKLLTICSGALAASGKRPAISSIIGDAGVHATNSLHYRGCAVDFADGIGNGFYDPKTKQGRPVGIAIANAASSQGLRIDPGSDQNQSFHLHADLGTTNCPDISAR